MPSKRLTEEGVHKLKAVPGKQVSYFDQGLRGLVLTVNPGGSKTWSALYYLGGKPRYKKLGAYPILSVRDARDKARLFLVDPQKGLKQICAATFANISENFIKRHVSAGEDRVELRSRREIERCLKKYVLPHWMDRSFEDIRRDDVTDLLDFIEDRHGSTQADRVLAILSKLMSWHQARVGTYTSPIVRGMKRDRRTSAQRARKRILNDDEIRQVWRACGDLGAFGGLVKLALLTGQRRQKLATMKWEDIKDGVWIIETLPREKGNGGVLRLPAVAMEIINAQHMVQDNPYVFAGSRRGRHSRNSMPAHFNSWSERKADLDNKLAPDIETWTIHDLRRTSRSLLSRAGIRPDIAERVIGHAILGVEAVYDRHRYEAEKANALSALACLIQGILHPAEAKVVTLAEVTTERSREAIA